MPVFDPESAGRRRAKHPLVSFFDWRKNIALKIGFLPFGIMTALSQPASLTSVIHGFLIIIVFSHLPLQTPLPSPLCWISYLVIPVDEVPVCEGPLSCEEVFTALQGMAQGKSPGRDGLPAEFYTCFWEVLGSDLVEVLNASYESGSLPFSQHRPLPVVSTLQNVLMLNLLARLTYNPSSLSLVERHKFPSNPPLPNNPSRVWKSLILGASSVY